jgi:hypothetical protein
MEELISTLTLIGGISLAAGLALVCAETFLSLLPAADDYPQPRTDP